MPSLIEVRFKGNRKEFFLWNDETPPPMQAPVVVEADRGEDLGYVLATGELALKRAKGVAHGPGEGPVAMAARRLATRDEVNRLEDLREEDETARRKAMERVRANNLQMKLSDAEWRWDRKKLTIYFTAEKRVDFRNLVRELASMFRTRIELKQIGVRDEARRLGGIGRCGREYCSASWLPELRPVNLGVAKDQRLSLNPSQISGACGRLMCCLRYEHDFYVQQRKKFPKEGKTVSTTRGEEKVVSNDIFRERVTLRSSEGEFRVVPLADLKREMDGRPAYPVHDEETPPIPVEGLTDEIIRLQDTSELPAWTPGGKRPVRRLPVVVEIAPEDVEEELQPAVVESAPETLVEQASPAAGAPAAPSASEESDAGEDDEAADDGEPEDAAAAGGDEARRPRGRRRRGRRGGRGGRRGRPGGDGSGGSPPGGGAAGGGPDAGGGA